MAMAYSDYHNQYDANSDFGPEQRPSNPFIPAAERIRTRTCRHLFRLVWDAIVGQGFILFLALLAKPGNCFSGVVPAYLSQHSVFLYFTGRILC